MSAVLADYARAAHEVVRALSTAGRVEYAEVVVTLPASLGERIDPAAVDDEGASVVSAVEEAGAVRAAVILLVNPREIVPRLSVLTLVAVEGETPNGPTLTRRVEPAMPGGFVQAQPVTVTALDDVPTRTLTDAPVTHRIDVMLAARDDITAASDPTEETR